MTVPTDSALDEAFSALAHPIRRALLQRLGREERATVSELAGPFEVSVMAVSKHLKVLAEAGLVEREAVGRERWYSLREAGLGRPLAWLLEHREFWSGRLDALAAHVEREEETNG